MLVARFALGALAYRTVARPRGRPLERDACGRTSTAQVAGTRARYPGGGGGASSGAAALVTSAGDPRGRRRATIRVVPRKKSKGVGAESAQTRRVDAGWRSSGATRRARWRWCAAPRSAGRSVDGRDEGVRELVELQVAGLPPCPGRAATVAGAKSSIAKRRDRHEGRDCRGGRTRGVGLLLRVQEALGELVHSAKEGLLALSVCGGLGVLRRADGGRGPRGGRRGGQAHPGAHRAVRHRREGGEVTLGGPLDRDPAAAPRAATRPGPGGTRPRS